MKDALLSKVLQGLCDAQGNVNSGWIGDLSVWWQLAAAKKHMAMSINELECKIARNMPCMSWPAEHGSQNPCAHTYCVGYGSSKQSCEALKIKGWCLCQVDLCMSKSAGHREQLN